MNHGDPTGTQCAVGCPNGDAARLHGQAVQGAGDIVAKHPVTSVAVAGAAVATVLSGGATAAGPDEAVIAGGASIDAAIAGARTAAAVAEANGATAGATSGLSTASGEVFTGASTNAGGPGMATNSVVQQALDSVPAEARSLFHGCCGEINAMSNAANTGAKLENGIMATVRATGRQAGKLMEGCSSCQAVAKKLGITLVSPN